MTAAMYSAPGSVADVSHRLGHLLNDRNAVAQWWVDLTIELDELSDRMVSESQTLWRALRSQLTTDAPYLSSQLNRIDAEADDLQGQVREVRMMAGAAAGDPEGARTVRAAVRDLLHRLRRHEERTTRLMVDAYVVDLGGE